MTTIAEQARCDVTKMDGLSISSLADVLRKYHNRMVENYREGASFTFIFKDLSYIKIKFSGTSRVDFEVGMAYQIDSDLKH